MTDWLIILAVLTSVFLLGITAILYNEPKYPTAIKLISVGLTTVFITTCLAKLLYVILML